MVAPTLLEMNQLCNIEEFRHSESVAVLAKDVSTIVWIGMLVMVTTSVTRAFIARANLSVKFQCPEPLVTACFLGGKLNSFRGELNIKKYPLLSTIPEIRQFRVLDKSHLGEVVFVFQFLRNAILNFNMITDKQILEIEKYIEENAREIDRALCNFYFKDGDASLVLDALKKYQNDDGGFGNAIEPDFRLPQSTSLGTWMAFQFIKAVDPDPTNQMVQRAIDYFVGTYDEERCGWAIILPEVNKYPHAPWWEYETAISHFGWGNPNAEILGLLIKYGRNEAVNGIISTMEEKAQTRVHEVNPSSFHEIFNFKALYQFADDELKKQLKEPLERLILKAAVTDPSEWKSYVATPIKFISSPDDPFINLFERDLINQNLDFIVNQIIDGDHWEPNWSWSDTYPDDWQVAKQEWCGSLTVQNLLTLRDFGIL